MKDLTGYQMGSDHLDVTQLPIKLKLESGPDDGHASGSLMKLYIYIYMCGFSGVRFWMASESHPGSWFSEASSQSGQNMPK